MAVAKVGLVFLAVGVLVHSKAESCDRNHWLSSMRDQSRSALLIGSPHTLGTGSFRSNDLQLPPNIRPMATTEVDYKTAKSIYDFTVNDIGGHEVSLEKYRGHVCIIVNVASKCGLTANNYKQLNEIYTKYSEDKGLRILAFPCNQFNGQEPGNSEEIVCFVGERNVKFDMFEKINVNGDAAHPLWKYLKHHQGGTLGNFIKWNFTKFIIDKNGIPVERHGPNVDPIDLVKSLEKYW